MPQTVLTSRQFEATPVKGSRFVVNVAAASSETAAKQVLGQARTRFADASHHCSAWRIASPRTERCSDDGEPRGSAGKPILNQLIGRDLVNVVVVVTRYFGGTKLGVGGLMRAYGGSAAQALDQMPVHDWVEQTSARFQHGYAYTDDFERLVAAHDGSIVSRSFTHEVQGELRLPADQRVAFATAATDLTAGSISLTFEP